MTIFFSETTHFVVTSTSQYASPLETDLHMFLPLPEGRRHDAAMLHMSGLLAELNHHAYSPTGQPLCIYGDPAYPLRIHLQAPYRNAHLTPEQQSFNSSMSSVRAAVEWVFGDISTYFALLDFKKNLKIGLSPVGKLYSISGLLKCYYDQILYIHFFTFSHTIGVSKIFSQISIYYEQQNSCFLDLYFREFTAAINFPCSKSGLRIGENDIIFSKIPHGLKL